MHMKVLEGLPFTSGLVLLGFTLCTVFCQMPFLHGHSTSTCSGQLGKLHNNLVNYDMYTLKALTKVYYTSAV